MWRRPALGLILVTAFGCVGDDDPSPPAPPPMEDADKPAPACPADDGDLAPTDGDAWRRWLEARRYTCWPSESKVHASTGTHPGGVRVYVNAALAASLSRGGPHPKGATAVKELYVSSEKAPRGWAAWTKTDASTAYWLELTPGRATAGEGLAECEGCHAAGQDHFLTTFPLK